MSSTVSTNNNYTSTISQRIKALEEAGITDMFVKKRVPPYAAVAAAVGNVLHQENIDDPSSNYYYNLKNGLAKQTKIYQNPADFRYQHSQQQNNSSNLITGLSISQTDLNQINVVNNINNISSNNHNNNSSSNVNRVSNREITRSSSSDSFDNDSSSGAQINHNQINEQNNNNDSSQSSNSDPLVLELINRKKNLRKTPHSTELNLNYNNSDYVSADEQNEMTIRATQSPSPLESNLHQLDINTKSPAGSDYNHIPIAIQLNPNSPNYDAENKLIKQQQFSSSSNSSSASSSSVNFNNNIQPQRNHQVNQINTLINSKLHYTAEDQIDSVNDVITSPRSYQRTTNQRTLINIETNTISSKQQNTSSTYKSNHFNNQNNAITNHLSASSNDLLTTLRAPSYENLYSNDSHHNHHHHNHNHNHHHHSSYSNNNTNQNNNSTTSSRNQIVSKIQQ